jgi:threonylcarbamoyladenosine tRNA methylthiotransferase MtaB
MPQVPRKVARERAARLRALGEQQYKALRQSRIGMMESVLFERDGLGRTAQFVPVEVPGHGPGEIVPVRITGLSAGGLVGDAIRTAA